MSARAPAISWLIALFCCSGLFHSRDSYLCMSQAPHEVCQDLSRAACFVKSLGGKVHTTQVPCENDPLSRGGKTWFQKGPGQRGNLFCSNRLVTLVRGWPRLACQSFLAVVPAATIAYSGVVVHPSEPTHPSLQTTLGPICLYASSLKCWAQ